MENLWVSRSGQRTKLYGKGKQYRARYIDTSGKETTKRFRYKAGRYGVAQADNSRWCRYRSTRSGGMDCCTAVLALDSQGRHRCDDQGDKATHLASARH